MLIYISLLIGYLIGSINSSIIICKILTGEDIRDFGSGNAGATNALRVLGKKAGILTLVFDALKTVIAILICQSLFSDNKEISVYLSGIGAILGHNFPVWFKFKGGKGIVVSVVTIFFADWKIGILIFVISISIMIISRYVSLGSIIGSILLIIFAVLFKSDNVPYLVYAVIISALAIYRHKTNISRLIKGTENKLNFSKKNDKTEEQNG